jgi:hypothetical protein
VPGRWRRDQDDTRSRSDATMWTRPTHSSRAHDPRQSPEHDRHEEDQSILYQITLLSSPFHYPSLERDSRYRPPKASPPPSPLSELSSPWPCCRPGPSVTRETKGRGASFRPRRPLAERATPSPSLPQCPRQRFPTRISLWVMAEPRHIFPNLATCSAVTRSTKPQPKASALPFMKASRSAPAACWLCAHL